MWLRDWHEGDKRKKTKKSMWAGTPKTRNWQRNANSLYSNGYSLNRLWKPRVIYGIL